MGDNVVLTFDFKELYKVVHQPIREIQTPALYRSIPVRFKIGHRIKVFLINYYLSLVILTHINGQQRWITRQSVLKCPGGACLIMESGTII